MGDLEKFEPLSKTTILQTLCARKRELNGEEIGAVWNEFVESRLRLYRPENNPGVSLGEATGKTWLDWKRIEPTLVVESFLTFAIRKQPTAEWLTRYVEEHECCKSRAMQLVTSLLQANYAQHGLQNRRNRVNKLISGLLLRVPIILKKPNLNVRRGLEELAQMKKRVRTLEDELNETKRQVTENVKPVDSFAELHFRGQCQLQCTPPSLLKALVEVYGKIETDVCTTENLNTQFIRASNIFTVVNPYVGMEYADREALFRKQNQGLGFVYCNPPGKPHGIRLEFVLKVLVDYVVGSAKTAALFIPNTRHRNAQVVRFWMTTTIVNKVKFGHLLNGEVHEYGQPHYDAWVLGVVCSPPFSSRTAPELTALLSSEFAAEPGRTRNRLYGLQLWVQENRRFTDPKYYRRLGKIISEMQPEEQWFLTMKGDGH